MVERHVRHLPIVNAQGELSGMLSIASSGASRGRLARELILSINIFQ